MDVVDMCMYMHIDVSIYSYVYIYVYMPHFVVQLYLTLCNSVGCSSPGYSVHGDSPGKNTGVGCHALLQGIFPTQGSNSGLHITGRSFTI